MKYTIPSSLALSLLGLGLLAGCGSNDSSTLGPDSTLDAAPADDAGGNPNQGVDANHPAPAVDANAPGCSASCQTDLDCTNVCGSTPTACCDVPTGKCYNPPSGICTPAPLDAGSLPD